MTDIIQQDYNKFTQYPQISYNCIKFLMENNDLVWKLLKYNTPDAYRQVNLTLSEKQSLVYAGQTNASDFRVFSDYGLDDSILFEGTILRISVLELQPSTYVFGHVVLGVEVYSHYKINMMEDYTTRIDTIVQQMIEVFNGADIDGIGRIYFDARANPRSRVSTIGSIPYKGKLLLLCGKSLG